MIGSVSRGPLILIMSAVSAVRRRVPTSSSNVTTVLTAVATLDWAIMKHCGIALVAHGAVSIAGVIAVLTIVVTPTLSFW